MTLFTRNRAAEAEPDQDDTAENLEVEPVEPPQLETAAADRYAELSARRSRLGSLITAARSERGEFITAGDIDQAVEAKRRILSLEAELEAIDEHLPAAQRARDAERRRNDEARRHEQRVLEAVAIVRAEHLVDRLAAIRDESAMIVAELLDADKLQHFTLFHEIKRIGDRAPAIYQANRAEADKILARDYARAALARLGIDLPGDAG